MKEFITKGGAKPTHWEQFNVSADQLANYLAKDVLGIPVRADFVTCHGTAGGCFVIMNISIENDDLTSAPQPGNYVDNFLSKNSAGILFKQDVIKAIEPFMFPEDYTKIVTDPIKMKALADIGICGAAFEQIRRFCRFRKSEAYNAWVISLNTENLIRDFFADPTTGKVEGDLKITAVTGERAPGIQWEIFINRDSTKTIDTTVSVDTIFQATR